MIRLAFYIVHKILNDFNLAIKLIIGCCLAQPRNFENRCKTRNAAQEFRSGKMQDASKSSLLAISIKLFPIFELLIYFYLYILVFSFSFVCSVCYMSNWRSASHGTSSPICAPSSWYIFIQ